LSSFYGNLGRAYEGQKKYEKASETFGKAVKSLEKDEYQYHQYEAHVSVTKCFHFISSSDYSSCQKFIKKCEESLNKIEMTYGTKHRYYFWLCREIAALQLRECQTWKSDWRKEEWQRKTSDALEMALQSLEGHLSLYKEMHHKTAKAAKVAALICLEFAQAHNEMSLKSHEAADRCLLLAIEIWKDLEESLPDKSFTSVHKTILNLESLLEQVRVGRSQILDEYLYSACQLAEEAIDRIKKLLLASEKRHEFEQLNS
jgi:tetratricopeptide (TPR) repeat protein